MVRGSGSRGMRYWISCPRPPDPGRQSGSSIRAATGDHRRGIEMGRDVLSDPAGTPGRTRTSDQPLRRQFGLPERQNTRNATALSRREQLPYVGNFTILMAVTNSDAPGRR